MLCLITVLRVGLLAELLLHLRNCSLVVYDQRFHIDELVLGDGRLGEQFLDLLQLFALFVDFDGQPVLTQLSVLFHLIPQTHQHLLWGIIVAQGFLAVHESLLGCQQLLICPFLLSFLLPQLID